MTSELFVTLVYILFLHFLGDFVLQKDSWAKTKSADCIALTKHVATYTVVMSMGMVPILWWGGLAFGILNGIVHWLTDYITSRGTKYYAARQDWHNFFVVVGIDQVVHYTVLFWFLLQWTDYSGPLN